MKNGITSDSTIATTEAHMIGKLRNLGKENNVNKRMRIDNGPSQEILMLKVSRRHHVNELLKFFGTVATWASLSAKVDISKLPQIAQNVSNVLCDSASASNGC